MKAQELRKGIIVLLGLTPVTVVGFNGTTVWHKSEYDTGSCQIESLAGIPLTEEILLKAGFEMKEGTADFEDRSTFTIKKIPYKYFENTILFVSNHLGHWRVSIFIDRGMNTIAYLRDIEFLHELQNIYYDLKHEELEVRL